jgi:tRNA (guanine-N(7)-)-methyltransferase
MRVRTLLNPFSCNQRYTRQAWTKLLPDHQGIIDVEIGFGNGQFLDFYAEQNPSRSVIGFEIRQRWVHFVQEKITKKRLVNVVAFRAHGQHALEDMFEDNSIDRIFIFHPDPWPRHGHRKRRIISQEFLDIAHTKLKFNGRLYIATDVPELWEYMKTVIIQHDRLKELTNDNLWETLYNTRWREMSVEHNRSLFFGTFQSFRASISPSSSPKSIISAAS